MKILSFLDFIFENFKTIQVPFQYCGEFESLINQINNPISEAFMNLRLKPTDISLINIGDQDDFVTFTTSKKLSQHFKSEDERTLRTLISPLSRNTEIYSKNRTSIKIGRLIRKLFGSKFSDSEIEKFVNQYKSIADRKLLKFELWDGYEIQNGYCSKNYTYEGSSSNPLLNSCMNDELHLIDFYKYATVKLLVLLNNEGHIFGRSLIWQTNRGTFMDRVYVAFDSDYYKFTDWATKNNIIYKSKNQSGPLIDYVVDGKTTWFPMKVELKFNIDEYSREDFTDIVKDIPYMDTFIYGQKNILSNYEPIEDKYYILTDTDGYPLEVIPHFDIKGRRIQQDELDDYEWSNTQKGWIHANDGCYVQSVQDFLSFDYLKDPVNGFKRNPGSNPISPNTWIKNVN